MTAPIKVSTKPWGELVDEADPEPEEAPAYVFSNGRKFANPKVNPLGGE